jgi:hypothetical protein
MSLFVPLNTQSVIFNTGLGKLFPCGFSTLIALYQLNTHPLIFNAISFAVLCCAIAIAAHIVVLPLGLGLQLKLLAVDVNVHPFIFNVHARISIAALYHSNVQLFIVNIPS